MKKILLLLLLIPGALNAQSLQDSVLAQIDQLFSTFKPQHPGCQLSISRNGQVIYSKAWGMADLERQVPLTTSSILEAGSVSKQFTAAAILILEQQGKLSLNDDIRKYLPEVPYYGTVIRIRHLLHHTSGLRDWGSVMEIAGWPRTTKTYSNNDALLVVSHQKALNNKPGDEYIYSNSNFNLLAIIVKRISGMELAAFTRKNIFEPADMTHTQWRDDYKRIVPGRAIAYGKTEKGYETEMPNEYAYGNGGLLTTTDDLLKWNDYYWAGKLGSPSLLNKQINVDPLNNGVVNPYAAGLVIAQKNGMDYVNHSGATAGYRAYLSRYPQLKLSIAYLGNGSVLDMTLINGVENLLVGKKTGSQSAGPIKTAGTDSEQLTIEQLKNYAGWYRNQRTGEGRLLQLKNGSLQLNGNLISPVSPGVFRYNNQQLQFAADKKFAFISADHDTVRYTPVKTAAITPALLKAYAGKYYSTEADASYTIIIKDGKAVLQFDPFTDIELSPTYQDGFNMPDFGGDLYFERDKHQKITGFKISIPRARNVLFEKVK